MKNSFLQATTRYNTTTENGAMSHSSTGSLFLDQFSKAGTYRGREQSAVNTDMALLWDENPELAMKMVFYLRMITRKNKGVFATEKVQKGQGARDEAFKRLLWVAKNHPKTFEKNLALIPEVGSWKDLIQLWEMDTQGVVDIQLIFDLIQMMVESNNTLHVGNIKKYIPTLRSKGKLNTPHKKKMREFVDLFMKRFDMSEKQYRKFKSSGESHQFQRVICAKEFNKLNFNRIAGKALLKLISKGKDGRNFFERHGLLDAYTKFIKSQPVAKFNGYPFELMGKVSHNMNLAMELTLNKQFDNLIQTAKVDGGGIKGNVWCALDTSGSMISRVANTTAYDICVSLGIYFSALNEGEFKDNVIMFDDNSRQMKLAGSFCDKVKQIQRANVAWGSTNFQSVIDEIVRIRKKFPNIPVEDYPETLLVVSDMQFNSVGSHQTNYERAMSKLREVGLPEIRIVWWWVTGRGTDFPSTIDDRGTIMIGGFDGAILTLLLGGDEIIDEKTGEKRKPTPTEAMLIALNQELLQNVKV